MTRRDSSHEDLSFWAYDLASCVRARARAHTHSFLLFFPLAHHIGSTEAGINNGANRFGWEQHG